MIPWEEIKTEYITTDMGYAKLAEKYGCHKTTLVRRGQREGWEKERVRHVSSIVSRCVRETEERAVDRLRTLREAAEKAAGIVSGKLDDCAGMSSRELKDYTGVLRDLNGLLRDFYNLPAPGEAQARELAAQRMELERRKLEAGIPDGTLQVILEGETEAFSR